MTDEEIRAVIRQVLAARGLPAAPAARPTPHASHVRLQMVVPTPAGSPCVIEPAVNCNNCGYCLSMGH
jgi:hypothetical protein